MADRSFVPDRFRIVFGWRLDGEDARTAGIAFDPEAGHWTKFLSCSRSPTRPTPSSNGEVDLARDHMKIVYRRVPWKWLLLTFGEHDTTKHSPSSQIGTDSITLGARSGPRAGKSAPSIFADPNNRWVNTGFTALFSADLRQGRSDQGSSPCSARPRFLHQSLLRVVTCIDFRGARLGSNRSRSTRVPVHFISPLRGPAPRTPLRTQGTPATSSSCRAG